MARYVVARDGWILNPIAGTNLQQFVEGEVDLVESRSLIRRPVGQSAITPFLPVFSNKVRISPRDGCASPARRRQGLSP
jgi:hypothetical protein